MAFMVRMYPTPPWTRLTFALAGQSGMSGRGLLADLPTFPNAARLFNYKNSGGWAAAAEPIDDETDQVDSVSTDVGPEASPGMAFADALAALRPYNEIGLIPCAKGGSSIAQWQKSGLSRTTLYGSMLARMQEASVLGDIRGFVFYQGETEAANQTAAEGWAASFLVMYDDLVADFGPLKAIVTELGPDPGDAGAYWATVQAQQQSLDGARSGNIVCVSAADLTAQVSEPIHLTTASLVTLGGRYATAMDALIG